MTTTRASRNSFRTTWIHLICVLILIFAGIGTLVAPSPVEAVTLTNVKGTVTVQGGLNLRSSANWTAPIIKLLPNGTSLQIKATSGDWFKVTALTKTGWVNSWYVTLSATSSKVITRGNTSRKMVALTFDAGSDLGYTEKIITILEREGIPGSFGLTGTWIERYPEYAEWIAADGFQILNHTLRHYSYTGASAGTSISPAKRVAQLVAAETEINGIGGSAKPYWRPPYGDYNSGVLRDAGAVGYRYTVMWSIDTLGWDGLPAGDITWRVLNKVGNGSIILMHVGSESEDALALSGMISKLRAKGYSFGTVQDVIS
jgi:peptidoglycan/xylan/chitin deacetylase (PgdA/CDA1 family)